MSNIPQLANVPDISFIENMTLQETENLVIEQFTRIFRECTGKDPDLGAADIKTLLIKAFSLIEYQTMQYIDAKGRGELLKTSTGEALDALTALLGITRREPSRAVATERFTLSAVRSGAVAIQTGTRVKTESGRYFNTLHYAEIPAGEISTDVMIQAEEPGTDSSGIQPGSINILVDPIPYVASVENITESTGGLDEESDDALTERAYLAPSKFSCAGPRDAYEYYVREWRSDVVDVQIVSPSPCVVEIYATVEDAESGQRVLNQTEQESLTEYINGETIRPLCDQVVCVAPEEVTYQIAFTYWIAKSDSASVGTIQERVSAAAEKYQLWQRTLGRDVNPTELIAQIREAGAKRVKLTEPDDVVITRTQLPKCGTVQIVYGGIEDD